jgi:hypothetical protein
MPSSWITGEAAWDPQLAEILVCPIFIRALAQVLRLSYGEELRRVLAYALLRPLGYRRDMSKARSACAWPKNVGSRFGNRQAVFHMKHSEYGGVAHAGDEAAAACLRGLPGLAHHHGHDRDRSSILPSRYGRRRQRPARAQDRCVGRAFQVSLRMRA